MENVVGPLARCATSLEVANVALDHPEATGVLEVDSGIVQVAAMASREVIHADHGLTEGEELLQEIGPDKAGNAGDHPNFRGGA